MLGARVLPGGVPSDALHARALLAAELWHRGRAPKLLLSGGVPVDGVTEAACALDLVSRAGVPASACILEEQSATTRENALETARLAREHGWRRMGVVTDDFHVLRARRFFARAGMRVTMLPVHRRLGALTRLRWQGREWLGVLLQPSLWWP